MNESVRDQVVFTTNEKTLAILERSSQITFERRFGELHFQEAALVVASLIAVASHEKVSSQIAQLALTDHTGRVGANLTADGQRAAANYAKTEIREWASRSSTDRELVVQVQRKKTRVDKALHRRPKVLHIFTFRDLASEAA